MHYIRFFRWNLGILREEPTPRFCGGGRLLSRGCSHINTRNDRAQSHLELDQHRTVLSLADLRQIVLGRVRHKKKTSLIKRLFCWLNWKLGVVHSNQTIYIENFCYRMWVPTLINMEHYLHSNSSLSPHSSFIYSLSPLNIYQKECLYNVFRFGGRLMFG